MMLAAAAISHPEFVAPFATLHLSSRRELFTLVDADDRAWLTRWRWNYGWFGHARARLYAKRNEGPDRSTVWLHRAIMLRAAPMSADFAAAHVVDHINNISLDNRRCNLRWATRAQNNAYRRLLDPDAPRDVRTLLAMLERAQAGWQVPF